MLLTPPGPPPGFAGSTTRACPSRPSSDLVTERAALIVTAAGLVEPVASPLHAVNRHCLPAPTGTAVVGATVTLLPQTQNVAGVPPLMWLTPPGTPPGFDGSTTSVS